MGTCSLITNTPFYIFNITGQESVFIRQLAYQDYSEGLIKYTGAMLEAFFFPNQPQHLNYFYIPLTRNGVSQKTKGIETVSSKEELELQDANCHLFILILQLENCM